MPKEIEITPKLQNKILDRLASGESLRTICKDKDMPSRATVNRWLASDPEFETVYARAKEDGVEVRIEELEEVIEEVKKGTLTPEQGRVIINATQWLIMKLKPLKYGDRAEHTKVTINTVNNKLDVTAQVLQLIPTEQLQAVLTDTESQAQRITIEHRPSSPMTMQDEE